MCLSYLIFKTTGGIKNSLTFSRFLTQVMTQSGQFHTQNVPGRNTELWLSMLYGSDELSGKVTYSVNQNIVSRSNKESEKVKM